MRLLIVSVKQHLSDYGELAEALDSIKIQTLVVHNLKHCFLNGNSPLHAVPIPKVLNLVKQFRPDFFMTDSHLYVSQMAKLLNQRVLFHMRGETWSEIYWDAAKNPSILKRFYAHYLSKLSAEGFKNTDLILPNSRWLQKRTLQVLPNCRAPVLYVGIDPKKWVSAHSIPNSNETFRLRHPAAVGLFKFNVYQKVLGLVRFMEVIRRMPNVNFYFAGIGPYIDLVRQRRPPNMFLLGWLQQPMVKKLVKNGDIFIHPSGTDAFPRGLKEVSLMEKPIVASNVGGIPEIVKEDETGYLCSVSDIDQWVKKINFLIDNPDVARKFGKSARKFVAERFNWQKIAADFKENLLSFSG